MFTTPGRVTRAAAPVLPGAGRPGGGAPVLTTIANILNAERAMTEHHTERSRRAYRIECDGGHRYVIYNTAGVDSPLDHVPNKWYVLPYPIPLGVWVGESFDSAEDAERSVRARHGAVDQVSVLS